jgi:hypothetical protein
LTFIGIHGIISLKIELFKLLVIKAEFNVAWGPDVYIFRALFLIVITLTGSQGEWIYECNMKELRFQVKDELQVCPLY